MSVRHLTLTRREQARKASEMQPQLSSEAERMLMKLRVSGFNTHSCNILNKQIVYSVLLVIELVVLSRS